MQRILLDTCAWIDFLRSKQGLLGDYVEQAIRNDVAVMCHVTIAELLQGAKGNKEKQQLELLFDSIESLSVTNEDWMAAGVTLQSLREKGITLPLTDALIAAVAVRNDLPVLTEDKHFQHLPVRLMEYKEK